MSVIVCILFSFSMASFYYVNALALINDQERLENGAGNYGNDQRASNGLYEQFNRRFNDVTLSEREIRKLCINLIYMRNLDLLFKEDDELKEECYAIYESILIETSLPQTFYKRLRRFFELPEQLDRSKIILPPKEPPSRGFKYGK